jgi:hypothetical protein
MLVTLVIPEYDSGCLHRLFPEAGNTRVELIDKPI